MAKVSVIVPVYNTENYIDICLDSLINQTFRDFEVICINDGSTDSSLQVLEQYSKYDKRIKVFSTENKGLSEARNYGVSLSKGKYVTFLDSDDYISPVMLEIFYKNLNETGADFVFGDSLKINPLTNEISFWDYIKESELKTYLKHPKDKWFNEKDVPSFFWEKINVCAWGKMYKRKFIENLKFPKGLIFEDLPYFTECYLKAEKISFDFRKTYFYRISRSDSIVGSNQAKYSNIFEIYDLVEDVFKKYNKFDKFKNDFLYKKIRDCSLWLIKSNGNAKEEMFKRYKETFMHLDVEDYNIDYLNSKKDFHFLCDAIKLDYENYLIFENKIKDKEP